MTKCDPSGPLQNQYDRALVEMMACQFLPFALADGPQFKNFVSLLNRTINLKHSTTYSRMLPKFSKEVMDDVMKMVEQHCDVSAAITTDMWTSRCLDSYMSITLHFIDKSFRLHRWTPSVQPFEGRHTGENIQQALDEFVLNKLDLGRIKFKVAVSDNCSNVVAAIRESCMEMYTCLCHLQQLGINDAFKAFKDNTSGLTMVDVIAKCKSLSTHLHKSEPSMKLLVAECSVEGHYPKNIPQANETRWDSAFTLLQGVIYHRECLQRLDREDELPGLVPTNREFLMIQGAVEVLGKCKETTKCFEQEKVPTLPLVVERIYTMFKEIEAFTKNNRASQVTRQALEFSKVLLGKLKERFPQYGMNRELNCMANYLNPALKGLHLKLIPGKFESTKQLLEEKLVEWDTVDGELLSDEEDDNQAVEEVPEKISVTEQLRRQMKQKRGRGVQENDMSEFERECQSYEMIPETNSKVDQLMWWRDHKEQLPRLSFLVRCIFPIPAASSKSERCFSTAGNTVTPKRSNLDPENVQDFVLMNLNLQLLKDMKDI
jgi:hypothetical protein